MAADGMTPRPLRMLVLDDDEIFQHVAQESLRASGFLVDAAMNLAEARQRIDSENYHVLIFDISVGGGGNRDWLDLFAALQAEGKTQSSLVVVITAYYKTDYLHEAVVDLHANEMLDKTLFHVDTFGARIRKVAEQLTLNSSLRIAWTHGPRDAAAALTNIKVTGKRVKADSDSFARLQEELDDLFCRLFARAESIVVSRLPFGRSGAGVVKVQPVVNGVAQSPVVVKFGDVGDIETERRNYNDYVVGMLGGNRSPRIESTARTRFLGGIAYSLLGAEEFEPFASFYSTASPDEIRQVLDHLFLTTCQRWYSAPMSAEVYDVAEEYRSWLGMTPTNLETAWTQLKTVQGGATLKFQSLSTSVTIKNPIPLVGSTFVTQTYRCVTHGDLSGGNILIDPDRKTWLIDFFRTGRGHVLRDHAFLDVYTRCVILGPDEATLDERLQLERALLELRRVDAKGVPVGHLTFENPALQKAFETSLHIRSLAAKQGHRRTSTDMPDYDIASMFYATNMIRYYHMAAVQKEHGMLLGGLLAERLGL